MMILKIYLGTCLFCFISFWVVTLELVLWAKQKGMLKKEKFCFSSFLGFVIKLVVLCGTPVFNVFFGYLCLFSETLRQRVKERL